MAFGLDIGAQEPEFGLEIAGVLYRGWTDGTIERGLEQFAHSFSLGYTDRWDDSVPWAIVSGDECTLKWGRQKIFSGFVTQTRKTVTGDSYDLGADGRSITGDLVDCTAIHGKGRWKNALLAQIVRDLCAPFGIEVSDQVGDTRPFKKFVLDEGETAHSAIDRACQSRGCLPVTDAAGRVVLSRFDGLIGLVEIDFETVISRTLTEGEQDRYSSYVFKGQTKADDENYSYNATTQKGEAVDSDIGRYRPLVIMAEESGSREDLGKRALWERNVRKARARRVEYTVSGFTDADGDLWAPGGVIQVNDTELDISGSLLIVSARHDIGEKTTTLELVDPVAYSVLE